MSSTHSKLNEFNTITSPSENIIPQITDSQELAATNAPSGSDRVIREWWEGHGNKLPMIAYYRYGGKPITRRQQRRRNYENPAFIHNQAQISYVKGGLEAFVANAAGAVDPVIW